MIRTVACIILFVLAIAAVHHVGRDDTFVPHIASEAVVVVYGLPGELKNSAVTIGTGAGFFIAPDIIATSYHIIESSGMVVVLSKSGIQHTATIYGYDRIADLALLKIDSAVDKFLTLDESLPEVGERITAIGHPNGLTYSVSAGIISHDNRYIYNGLIRMLQIDAAISAGSSGGPIFNNNSAVIGIVQAIVSTTDQFTGFGLAYSSMDMLSSISLMNTYKDRIARRATTGLEMSNSKAACNTNTSGLEITHVSNLTDANEQGIANGDYILSINGRRFLTSADVDAYIHTLKPNNTVSITLKKCDRSTPEDVRLKLGTLM